MGEFKVKVRKDGQTFKTLTFLSMPEMKKGIERLTKRAMLDYVRDGIPREVVVMVGQ